MVIKVDGPRAQERADVMTKEGGLPVIVNGGGQLSRAIGPPAPKVSQTLHTLLNEAINSNTVVTMHAFGHPPVRLGKIFLTDSYGKKTQVEVQFLGDSFDRSPHFQRPHRSVYVSDLKDIFSLSPVFGKSGALATSKGIF